MKTELIRLSELSEKAFAEAIEKAAEYIRNGELVGIPTETVYGLAGSAYYANAAEKIFSAKGRPSDNPLIVHIAKATDAENIAETTQTYYKLAEKFMPGPLTIILPKKSIIPDTVSGGLNTVAVRCPSHPIARMLIEVSGHPIAAPSANTSGKPSPTTAEHVYTDLCGKIPLILDGGSCSIGLESTVVALNGEDCTILRPGAVTEEMLAEICRSVSVAEAVRSPEKAGNKPLSPGMKYKHYAPNCQVILLDGADEQFISYIRKNAKGKYGILTVEENEDIYPTEAVRLSLGKKEDYAEHCRRLFKLLRRADELELTRLYAKLPPESGLALAYYNRIIRAAGGNVIRIQEEHNK
ncbi:MAG: threonylcarbamoyl-AMP synthase [Clostridia bacterium]|nr:threonylcarbamoyl-AMP synthase [Clostridia bacterium]